MVCQACVLHCPCAFGRFSEAHATLCCYTLKLGVSYLHRVVYVLQQVAVAFLQLHRLLYGWASVVVPQHAADCKLACSMFAVVQWPAGLVCGEGHGAEA
jgi:hypothetical protein